MPAAGALTVLDVVLDLGQTGGDLSRVFVRRRAGASVMVVDVDVLSMLRTGQTTANVCLLARDVVEIAP